MWWDYIKLKTTSLVDGIFKYVISNTSGGATTSSSYTKESAQIKST